MGRQTNESVHKQGMKDQFVHVCEMTAVLSHSSEVVLRTERDFEEAIGGLQNFG